MLSIVANAAAQWIDLNVNFEASPGGYAGHLRPVPSLAGTWSYKQPGRSGKVAVCTVGGAKVGFTCSVTTSR